MSWVPAACPSCDEGMVPSSETSAELIALLWADITQPCSEALIKVAVTLAKGKRLCFGELGAGSGSC